MQTSTATLVHTSSRHEDNAVRIARVAAAGRVAAARVRAEQVRIETEAHATRVATEWIEDVRALGATVIGFKVCDDYGKYRFRLSVEDATASLVSHWGADIEAWAVTAEGEYVGESW
jgi:hypothetical protein